MRKFTGASERAGDGPAASLLSICHDFCPLKSLLSLCGPGAGPEITLLYYNTGHEQAVQEAFRLRILHVMQVSGSVHAHLQKLR